MFQAGLQGSSWRKRHGSGGVRFFFQAGDGIRDSSVTGVQTCALPILVPDPAVERWSVVVKTLIFAAFIPYVIRSRIQIEAFLQIWVFGFAINFLPPGLKAMISGASYGHDLGVATTTISNDARWPTIPLMLVPIILFLRNNPNILP